MKFPIPEAALAQHIAVLGMTGAGKTSTEKLVIEHVVDMGARVCVLDTLKSDWWGITSSASGKSPGLPFKILGGPRGHVPLHSSAGKAIGQLVGSGKLPLSIIDMADFEAGGPQRFFVDFAQSLWKSARGVVYLVIEEAHELAPKERAGFNQENMAIHWAKKLATGSRTKGIRLVVATQRVQSLHNAVLSSCGTLIAHRVMFDADQEPVIRWVKGVSKEAAAEIAPSLSSLPDGTAWVCSGREQFFRRIAFPKFRTFDNTATPTGDDEAINVKTAPVDQDELRAIIGDAVKEAEANDPATLRKRIAELERQLKRPAQPTIDDKQLTEARAAAYKEGVHAGLVYAFERFQAHAQNVIQSHNKLHDAFSDELRQRMALAQVATPPAKHSTQFAKLSKPQISTPVKTSISTGAKPDSGIKLSKAERLALTAIAQYPNGRTKNQVAILTGYAHNGGGFNNALSSLRSKGFIEGSSDRLVATEAGLNALGPFDPLPHGDELLQYWFGQLSKAERAALQALCEAYPGALTKEELAHRAGYEPNGGGFNNALSRLRTLELISGRGEIRASENLFS